MPSSETHIDWDVESSDGDDDHDCGDSGDDDDFDDNDSDHNDDDTFQDYNNIPSTPLTKIINVHLPVHSLIVNHGCSEDRVYNNMGLL